ncbi:hypothetical protein F5Y16DRAFT_406121 [Xylariaceae sp. FL0255]|nr:hypothetical protein F5Y16DRAFT_406121 [Xylariaceae sp. FL0255]
MLYHQLGELVQSLTAIIRGLTTQQTHQSTASDNTSFWSDLVCEINKLTIAVNTFLARQDLETAQEENASTQVQMQARRKGAHSATISPLSFDHNAIMVDVPTEAVVCSHDDSTPSIQKELLDEIQDGDPVIESRHARTLPDTPIAEVSRPEKHFGPRMTFPNLSGPDSEILEQLVQFGIKYWPDKKVEQFRSGQHVAAETLYDLLRIDLPAQYTLGIPPNRVNKLKETCAGTIMPYHVNHLDQLSQSEYEKNHFVIAVVNKQNKTFVSWGMSTAMHEKSLAEYREALKLELTAVAHQLGDYTGNCCAFRCAEAIRSYFGIDRSTRNEVQLRCYFLEQLLGSWMVTSSRKSKAQCHSESSTIVASSSSQRAQLEKAAGYPDTKQVAVVDPQQLEGILTEGIVASPASESARVPLLTKSKLAGKRLADKPEQSQAKKNDIGIESIKPPPKRKCKETPSIKTLAKELTGSGAIERIRQHVLAWNRGNLSLPGAWDKEGDWARNAIKLINDADNWDEKSALDTLVALTLRTRGVECIFIRARSMLCLDEEAPDPRIPSSIIDEICPHIREKRTPTAFRTWLTISRKLMKLSDYLPYLPLDSKSSVHFRHYERLPNDKIQQLLELLDKEPGAQRLARIGRAFRDRILNRQAFLWEGISSEELSNFPDDSLLELLTIRCNDNPGSTKLSSLALASRQRTSPACEHDDWEPVSSEAHYDDIAVGIRPTQISETTPLASAALWQAENRQVPSAGPQLQLSFPVIVPDTAQSITFAMNGNIDGLKHLFSLGLASPNDRSYSRGFSLLRWALYGGHSGYHHYEIVQFLFDHGAHADDESYETVGYYSLSKKYSSTVRQALRRFERQDRNWFREQNFPLIHNIIFGLSRKPLADELLQNPGAVLATDARGRTALDWATIRAQLDDMKLLIAHGSSLKSMDSFGRTTILHAVDSRDTEALHIILGAGADPEPQIPKGLFRGNPLTSASLNGLPGMVNLLIEFGADIDAANPEGLTALHSAAISQNPECASILLAHGADMDQTSSNGYTPIMTTIMQNSHAVLRVLLNKRTGSLDSSQLFSIVVEHADSETMSILASSQLFNPSGDCLPADRTILSCRKDYNDALSHAFENLFSVSAAHYRAP